MYKVTNSSTESIYMERTAIHEPQDTDQTQGINYCGTENTNYQPPDTNDQLQDTNHWTQATDCAT